MEKPLDLGVSLGELLNSVSLQPARSQNGGHATERHLDYDRYYVDVYNSLSLKNEMPP